MEVPKLRIVPEDLWLAVQTRIEHVNAELVGPRLGGMNRTTASRSYLFSRGTSSTVVRVIDIAECVATPSQSDKIVWRSSY